MIKKLALFPLNLVVFPGEELNLHVFEPRYKALINDCLEQNKSFGIPAYIRNELDMGTEVKITEIVKTYDDGRMDIRTNGLNIFNVITYQNPAEGKLYSIGTVDIQPLDLTLDAPKVAHIKSLLDHFYKLLKVDNPFLSDQYHSSFHFAHKIGLSLKEEYLMLNMETEQERLDFIIGHLEKTMPVIKEIEKTKEKIALNGHFKKSGPLNF